MRRIFGARRADHVDFLGVDVAAGIRQDQAHGIDGGRFGIGFDIQGQYAKGGFPVRRLKIGVVVNPIDPVAI